MDHSFYEALQSSFAAIRFCNQNNDKERYEKAITNIKSAKKLICKQAKGQEKDILLYCIDTLFNIINEGNTKKLFDFADAIHNIPEIYMQKRNLYSFRSELKSFQKKYGKQYFPFINNVNPHFSKKAPKNKWEFFSPAADEDFKRLHPVGYKILCLIGITVLMIPQIIYIAYVAFINPAPNEWLIILGLVGAFIVGTGFFNIVAAWIHQYLGHLFTVICLIGGAALTFLSMYLLYT